MRIKCLDTFLHGRDKFVKGDTRTVSQTDGEYFCKNGWAEDIGGDTPTGDAASGDTILDVQDVAQNQDSPGA